MEPQRAQRQVRLAAWSSVWVNIVLTIVKGAVGLMTGSRALFADAVHSAADVAGSVAVIIGLRIARKPPDEDHPYGHGKAELISSAIVALFLIAAGLDVGVSAVKAWFHAPSEPRLTAAYTAAGAIVIKEVMFQYSYRLGKRMHSRSLVATAYDHRSDVLSSTAALVGIVLSLVGLWTHQYWLLHMDALAGALVAVLVMRMGYKLAQDSLQTLMDRAVEHDSSAYRAFVEQVPGVEQIEELRVRDHGQYVIVDVKISVAADITVAAGHDIADEVKGRMTEQFPRVLDVFVHVNPFYADEWLQEGGRPHD